MILRHLILILFLSCQVLWAQTWQLEIKSKVELWTWNLSTQIEKNVTPLEKASIKLIKSGVVVKEIRSALDGSFSIQIPANGIYELLVSYPKCNPKKIIISTQGVPKDVSESDFKPVYPMKGVIMAKPIPGVDYSLLKEDLIKIKYFEKGSVFDKDDANAELIFEKLAELRQKEDDIMNLFCKLNRDGDAAMAIPDCPLAKSLYEKALKTIPNEWYPLQQLKKIGACGIAAPSKTNTAKTDAPPSQDQPKVDPTPKPNTSTTVKSPKAAPASTIVPVKPQPTGNMNNSQTTVQTSEQNQNSAVPQVLGQYQYDSLLQFARHALTQKQFDEGINACKKALKIRKNDYDATILLDRIQNEKRSHVP